MQIDVKEEDIDRLHKLGKRDNLSGRSRPVIVKFARYNKK